MALGSRFSKSSSEREKILHRRKENMIQMARRRYIEKKKAAAAAVKSELQSSWKRERFKWKKAKKTKQKVSNVPR